ncbi:MAG: ribonuclease HII [Verrucomicrobiota bacterium]
MPDLSLEAELKAQGYQIIAGIDEAGRGPLAGPVSVAAVILTEDYDHPKLNDSKKLTEKARETIYEELIADPRVTYHSVQIDSVEIDKIDILRATWKGMAEAFAGLTPSAEIALIDGKEVGDFPHRQKAVIKGDSKSLSIAAASVIAKVERDRMMRKYAERYPHYGFEKHKGYGTKAHLEALMEHGPCEIHRMSFSPCQKAAELF